MTADPLSGTALAWNVIGLPMSVSDGTDTARRVYAADGALLAVYSGSIGTEGRVRIGNFDILSSSSGALSLESAGWEGGRLLPGTGYDKILYHITDHLGSVRVVKDGTGAVLQRFDYYPFGSISGSWSSSANPSQPSLRYRFSGKEIAGQIIDASLVASALAGTPAAAAGTPYLDFGARLYDPRSAAWLSQDPLAEKYYHISPYAYCANNPVSMKDEKGLSPIHFIPIPFPVLEKLGDHNKENQERTPKEKGEYNFQPKDSSINAKEPSSIGIDWIQSLNNHMSNRLP